MDTYESILLVKNEVFVFKIPPLKNNRGYKAADWNLQEPQWTGRMRLVSKGNDILLKLEDKNSGELFAKCPIDTYPGLALESVTDSSRYFVVRIQDDSGRNAFIGLGFGDRSDSFDLNVALQDHFKWLKNQKQAETAGPQQELDLSFKDGETIKINMKITKKDGSEALSRAKPKAGSGSGLLPPPPGAPRIPPPSPQHAASSPSNPTTTEWGEYSSGSTPPEFPGPASATHSGVSSNNSNWVQF